MAMTAKKERERATDIQEKKTKNIVYKTKELESLVR